MDDIFNKYDLNKEIEKLIDETSLCVEGKPSCVIIAGGTGSGKTTLRKKDYSKGYVIVDAVEILENLSGNKGFVNIDQGFEELMQIIGTELVKRTIKEKRNFVTEIIGNDENTVKLLIDGLSSIGYETKVAYVHCDPTEAYNRHLKAVDSDPHYLSSYFTQESHIKWILAAVKNNN